MGRAPGGRKAAGATSAAPFLVKTHRLVEEGESDEVISWGEGGRSFVVWKPVEFARDLLPLHFKHCNFSSFVRQLNTYGFRKVVADRWEFANDNFRRGEQRLLAAIRRRKATAAPAKGPPSPAPPAPAPQSAANSGTNDRSSLAAAATSSSSSDAPPPPDLAAENMKLRSENRMLSSDLEKSRRQCDDLRSFVTRFLDVPGLDLRLLMDQAAAAAADVVNSPNDESVPEMKKRACEDGAGVKLFGVQLISCGGSGATASDEVDRAAQ